MSEQHGAGAIRSDSGILRVRRITLLGGTAAAMSALTEVLTGAGYLVKSASALDDVEALITTFSPHAVLVDLDGSGLPHRFRWTLASGTSLPIIGMGLESVATDPALAAFLPKPIDVDLLLTTIARVVDDHSDPSARIAQKAAPAR
jgi:DNA-binding response OmpR family regulator